jgi:hypothetical protein
MDATKTQPANERQELPPLRSGVLLDPPRVICRFSCGAASAVATKLAIAKYGTVEIYGYTVEEKHRLEKWRHVNFERTIECPLIDKNLTKSDCLAMVERAGIELPVMYRLGFRNNNCIGCVKARDNLDYWKRVRLHFPEVFARRAKQERDFKIAINRRTKNGVRSEIYLDEIEPGEPKGADPHISCGLFCMAESDALAGGSNDES